MSRNQMLELLDRHLAAENAHDLAGTLATLTEDCVFAGLARQLGVDTIVAAHREATSR